MSKINTEESTYRIANTLGTAVKNVERVLPATSLRRTVILAKVIENLGAADKMDILNKITKGRMIQNPSSSNVVIADIHEFYERDDISRVSPKMNDVKSYECAVTGNDVLQPMRHMVLTIKKAYALFVEDRENAGKGIFNLNSFFKFRYQNFGINFTSLLPTIFRYLQPQSISKTSATIRPTGK